MSNETWVTDEADQEIVEGSAVEHVREPKLGRGRVTEITDDRASGGTIALRVQWATSHGWFVLEPGSSTVRGLRVVREAERVRKTDGAKR